MHSLSCCYTPPAAQARETHLLPFLFLRLRLRNESGVCGLLRFERGARGARARTRGDAGERSAAPLLQRGERGRGAAERAVERRPRRGCERGARRGVRVRWYPRRGGVLALVLLRRGARGSVDGGPECVRPARERCIVRVGTKRGKRAGGDGNTLMILST